ncbi:hypothetical protein GCM10018785_06220 [Streptomyces longispororuber]|uniref:Cyclodipeptide synthase n=1 Tax=Streptomyces longispororuber TaxID=68230 RepID=A0A918Z723_9ACTN|nr:hypothetical protein GCM10018785_06220 [Streptomyces longispororuber]
MRALAQEPVEAWEVESLLDAALAAPSCVNNQAWHFTVVRSPELVRRLVALDDPARLTLAARYLLEKMPTCIDTGALVGAESSVRCYHRPSPLLQRFFERAYQLQPSPNQGHLQVVCRL